MKHQHLADKSVEELWALHEEIVGILAARMQEEKKLLERRLKGLNQQREAPPAKRPYPPVQPKYRNPADPSETWAGRGKKPRWVVAALKKGKRLEDLKIAA
jgi:DNA-binding protein H-NS